MLSPAFYATLDELAAAQSREWFRANRERVAADCEQPLLRTLQTAARTMSVRLPGLRLGEARLFRMARDVRFSQDKRPYKEHVAGTVASRAGETGAGVDGAAALFLHIGLQDRMAGAGVYVLDGAALERYRQRALDEATGSELHGHVSALRACGFEPVAGASLKKAPRGVDPGHPRIDLIRLKGLALMFPPWPEGIEMSASFPDWLAEQALAALPVVQWMDACLE